MCLCAASHAPQKGGGRAAAIARMVLVFFCPLGLHAHDHFLNGGQLILRAHANEGRTGIDIFVIGKVHGIDYARWAGYRDVRLIWVSESMSQGGGFQPMPMPMMEMAAAKMAVPPIEAGQVTTGVSVSVKFEMVK